VLSFFSSRQNWVSPTPFTRRRVCSVRPPPPLVPGDTFAWGRGGGVSQSGRGDRHCGTLGIYVLCTLYSTLWLQRTTILAYFFCTLLNTDLSADLLIYCEEGCLSWTQNCCRVWIGSNITANYTRLYLIQTGEILFLLSSCDTYLTFISLIHVNENSLVKRRYDRI
jgi:hypothetical protein